MTREQEAAIGEQRWALFNVETNWDSDTEETVRRLREIIDNLVKIADDLEEAA